MSNNKLYKVLELFLGTDINAVFATLFLSLLFAMIDLILSSSPANYGSYDKSIKIILCWSCHQSVKLPTIDGLIAIIS